MAQLEALKLRYNQPWEVIMIDAAEKMIAGYFPAAATSPAPAPGA